MQPDHVAEPSPLRHILLVQCDKCHVFPGFDFCDGWWLCLFCRGQYLDQVAREMAEGSGCPVN